MRRHFKAPGDWVIPGWIFYLITIILLGFSVKGMIYYHNAKAMQTQLLAQQNVAQGNLNTAKNNQTTVQYTVSPSGNISQQGLNLIHTGDHIFKLGTTFGSQSQYQANVQQVKKSLWDNSMFSKNAFFGPRDNYFSWVQSVKSKTQEVDTYQLSHNQYLSIVRFVTYTNPDSLNYLDQLHNTYRAFIFSGTNHTILKMTELDSFYSPSGYQSNS